MTTKNFINFMRTIFAAHGSGSGYATKYEIKNVSGTVNYIGTRIAFPSSLSYDLQINSNNSSGIWLGNGTTQPTADDYTIESRITSGISLNGTTFKNSYDENDNLQKEILLNLHNSSNASITISEIALMEPLYYVTSVNGVPSLTNVYCLDRTLLDVPVVIPAGDDALIKYILKTIMPIS